MNFVTETLEEKPTVLIVSAKNNHLVTVLKDQLKKNKADVFFSSLLPKNLNRFEYYFFIDSHKELGGNLISKQKKVTHIFVNSEKKAKLLNKNKQEGKFKIVNISGNEITQAHADKILWFAFSQTKESFLQLSANNKKKPLVNPKVDFKLKLPNGKKLIFTALALFLFLHLAFALPLFGSIYLFYRSAVQLKQGDVSRAEKNYAGGNSLFSVAKATYQIPRVTFLIFSFTLPDSVFKNTERTQIILDNSLNLQKNSREILKLILNKDKSEDEKKQLNLRLETVKKGVNEIEENINNLNQEIPKSIQAATNLKNELNQFSDLLSRIKQILPNADSFFAKNSEKTYLLIFANNMEIRPGGGFIGSFGLLRIKDYTVEEIKIYDVYDADGQLVAHVEPPEALRKYLNQPNWFLRDSAFSPDLLENYAQAKFFLEKEMGFDNFSGAILITTSAVQKILSAFPEIYLSDFNEKINQKNFYLKTQYYSEKNFFPGSIQKKNFLGSLTKNILLNLENASPGSLIKSIKTSLDEKQISIYFDDPKLQKVIDTFYWSGRIIEPVCSNQDYNCINDYLFPIDANLGLNKVNFFVKRNISNKITFAKNGKVFNTFSINFNNDSVDAFPGGTYKNYFQLFLPLNTEVKNISKDGASVVNFDQEDSSNYKKIGFLLEIPPKSSTEVKVEYQLAESLKKGKNIYQLIAQKQIGSANSDFNLELIIDKNIHLLNQNFPALVKDGSIVYNTSLTTDKIFLIELIKE